MVPPTSTLPASGIFDRANLTFDSRTLRKLGSIEQDADLVMFIFREEVYQQDDPEFSTQIVDKEIKRLLPSWSEPYDSAPEPNLRQSTQGRTEGT